MVTVGTMVVPFRVTGTGSEEVNPCQGKSMKDLHLPSKESVRTWDLICV